jgi:hypothetical protein
MANDSNNPPQFSEQASAIQPQMVTVEIEGKRGELGVWVVFVVPVRPITAQKMIPK